DRRHPRILFHFGIHHIPWLGARGEDVHARLVPGRIVQARRVNGYELRTVRRLKADRRAAVRTESARHGFTAGLRLSIKLGSSRQKPKPIRPNNQKRSEGASARTLAIATVTIRRHDGLRRALISNRAAGAPS